MPSTEAKGRKAVFTTRASLSPIGFFTIFVNMNPDRFSRAMAAFDAYHQRDPNREVQGGQTLPKEFLYAKRMTDRLASFAPEADEALRLAARCQHIGRWEIPREKYPIDKKGYLQWRNEEKFHHARIAEAILSEAGYDAATIEKVKTLLLKKELTTNADTQLMEDVACLVFLEFYLDEFSRKHDEGKVADILRKTLRKMSPSAKAVIPQIKFPSNLNKLLRQASGPAE